MFSDRQGGIGVSSSQQEIETHQEYSYDALAPLLQRCHYAATTLLQRCYDAATTLLRRCYNAATTLLMLLQRAISISSGGGIEGQFPVDPALSALSLFPSS